jgi:hypothetical protein
MIKWERREEREGQRARMDVVDEKKKERRVEKVWSAKRKVKERIKKNTVVTRELMERKASNKSFSIGDTPCAISNMTTECQCHCNTTHLQAAHEGGCSSIAMMKGGYSYHSIVSFRVSAVHDREEEEEAFIAFWDILFASRCKSHSMKSIIARAKLRERSLMRDAERWCTNSTEKGSRAFAVRVTWQKTGTEGRRQ